MDIEHIYPTLQPQLEYDTRSIFKQSKAGLNSEFSYSSNGFLIKAKEPSLPYYLLIDGEKQMDSCLLLEH